MERNVGTTFICLALSNFLCSKLGKKTAYIEFNTTDQIRVLSTHKNTKQSFSYYGIDLFSSVDVTSLSKILGFDYEYFVLDMGVLNAHNIKDFSKCDLRFIVCSLSKWKRQKTTDKIERFFQQIYTYPARVTLLDNLSEKKSGLSVFPVFSLPTISFPYISNPFQLKPEDFRVFFQLLERNLYTKKI